MLGTRKKHVRSFLTHQTKQDKKAMNTASYGTWVSRHTLIDQSRRHRSVRTIISFLDNSPNGDHVVKKRFRTILQAPAVVFIWR